MARALYKEGESYVKLAKINVDNDNRLPFQYEVKELPIVFIEDYTQGKFHDRERYGGELTASELLLRVRDFL